MTDIDTNWANYFFSRVSELSQAGIDVSLRATSRLEGGAIGYYYPHVKIVVAIRDPDWRATFVHEYCHFRQDLSGKKGWDCRAADTDITEDMLPAEAEYIASQTMLKEFDCDRRALREIKRHSLPIDAAVYAKDANAYALQILYSCAGTAQVNFSKAFIAALPGDLKKTPQMTPEMRAKIEADAYVED